MILAMEGLTKTDWLSESVAIGTLHTEQLL